MRNFSFEHPRFLLALVIVCPLLVLASWRSRAHNSAAGRVTTLVLRCAWVVTCLIAAAEPIVSRTVIQPVAARVYILEDASRSVADAAVQTEAIRSELHTAIGAGPEMIDLKFAAGPWRPADAPGDTSQTDVEAAINYVNTQSLDAPDVRVILLSDGRATHGDAVEAANRLALRGASIYTVPIGTHHSSPARVVRAEPPADAHVGVPGSARVTLASDNPVRADVQLVNSAGTVIDHRALTVHGEQTLVLHFTPTQPGVEVYSIRVDTIASPGKSSAIADTKALSVYVQGPPRLLLCDNFPAELGSLQKAIEPLKVPIDLIAPDQWPADLSPYAAIVISDWSGKELTEQQRGELRKYVEEQGGGLVFIGGGNVLPARWKQNPLAELLPVVLKDKPALLLKQSPDASVVFVVDRSGSMRETLGGAVPVSKMDMVKAAIIASLQTLPEHTQVGVVSFDSQVDILVPPTDVSKKEEISRCVDTLAPRGGTVIEPAIREGMALLARMPGKKYLIVLTDGIGERPSSDVAYWGAVADDARKAHISWTSVAVGQDADQALLSYLADETRGKYYFCDTADKIPRVFQKQAESIRNIQQQRERPFQPGPGPAVDRLKSVLPADMPELGGSVRASAREHVDVVLLGEDHQPLLAGWQFGLGRVVAFTSDAKAGWANQWITWKGYSAFWLPAIQEVMRTNPVLHTKVSGHIAGGRATFNIKATDQNGNAADNLKTTGGLSAAPGVLGAAPSTAVPVVWTQMAPGEYQVTADVPLDGQNYLLSLALEKAGGSSTRYCAIITAQRDLEMAETGPDLSSLRAIAETGHGLCSDDIGLIASECRRVEQRETVKRSMLWKALVIAALLLLPLDIAARKFL